MKRIPLTQGQFALVDDEDFDWLSRFRWYARWDKSTQSYYAARRRPKSENAGSSITMHRQILGLEYGDKRKGEHGDRNTLNNQRWNIRIATHSQNMCNRGLRRTSLSGLKGVSWHKRVGLWQAQIQVDGKSVYLGYFKTKHEAHEAYAASARELHGEFARIA